MFEKKQSYTPTESSGPTSDWISLLPRRTSICDRPMPIGDTLPAEFKSR